jgi:hypothetical protein
MCMQCACTAVEVSEVGSLDRVEMLMGQGTQASRAVSTRIDRIIDATSSFLKNLEITLSKPAKELARNKGHMSQGQCPGSPSSYHWTNIRLTDREIGSDSHNNGDDELTKFAFALSTTPYFNNKD